MWQCEHCYNAFHLNCIKTWAEPDETTISGIRRLFSWTCPICSVVRIQRPKAECWCGKQSSTNASHGSEGVDRPNSCLAQCKKVAKCIHNRDTDICTKQCHPGPCNQTCKADCADLPEMTPQKPSLWFRVFKRLQQRRAGAIRTLLMYTFFLIALYSCIIFFIIKHIQWWSEPWRHRHFTEVSGTYESVTVALVGILVVMPSLILLLALWTSSLGTFFILLLNLDDRSTRGNLKAGTKGIGLLILGLLYVAALITPLIA